MTTIAEVKASLGKLNASLDAMEASAGLHASAEEIHNLTRILARHGVSLQAANGANKSADVLMAEVGKLAIDPAQRIELKRRVERLAAGIPV